MISTKPLLKVGTALLLTVPVAMGIRDSIVGERRAALVEAESPSEPHWAQVQKEWRENHAKPSRLPA